MDKETLSNYGWIVICVLVLAVMIALATPFGSFVSEAVQSTTKGLFDVNKNALDAAGVPGLTVQDQEFDVPDMNSGTNNEAPPAPVVPGATFNDGVTLTWDELKLAENGTKYGYRADLVSDTALFYNEENHTGAFDSCTSLISVTIPDSVTSIGKWAFRNCSSLTSITIGNGVTSIGLGAFVNCTGLTSITIPDGVASIVDGAFYGCSSLTSITIPNSITSIGKQTFYNCSGLTSITIPDSVTSIGQMAFQGCSSLTSIIIPDGVTSIGVQAFYNCPSLTDVYYTGTQEQWNAITIISGNTPLTNATKHYNYVP